MKTIKVKVNRIVNICVAVILLICWGSVLLAGGSLGAASWWFIWAFSAVGVLIFVITWIRIIRRAVGRKPIRDLWLPLFLSVIAAWPSLWLFGVGTMTYPADINHVKPAVSVRLPFNQPITVGWGGDRLKINYHAQYPNERWAYDLLAEPYGMGSKKLEDYEIYGMEVAAPASGTVISAYDDEPDHEPGNEEYQTMPGNHVYIRLEETGTYLVLAHLKQGSVRVKEGQSIKEGTPIALVGNSGSSSEPHLHIHHQRQDPTKTSMFLSEGLPLYFRDTDAPPMPERGMVVSPK
ncbi:M23 family metallopeptidase [Paenibacillus caui]|uniref:M23 family metallopeptidase n=1 Tax=Paenibacillus caui TaxID=2873927 RepID=UPI001F346B9D|nr:M23 family metallopeptidase [Paenibacillus caui]